MKGQQYIHKKTIEKPGFIARVFVPVLTPEERQRRTEAIKTASANLVKEVLKK